MGTGHETVVEGVSMLILPTSKLQLLESSTSITS